MRRFLFWATLVSFLLLCASLIAVRGVVYQTRSFIYADITTVPTTTAAMVLGASVLQSGDLSPVLRERADKAYELYAAHKVLKILVTGDNSDLSHNEVNPVGKYLVSLGIPKEDIFLDHAGFDTYSSMYRARDVFNVRSLTIVSQPFHLARALFIAQRLGLVAYGAEAGVGERFRYNSIREIPATLKALFDVSTSRTPKYLGTEFPIGGNGSSTWQ